jgi:putative membrane protein
MKERDVPALCAVAVLHLFGVVGVVGYATFALNPQLLAGAGAGAARFYGRSFGFFAQGQIALSAVVLAFLLTRAARFAWVPAFAAAYGISLASELAGTTWGVPFGAYAYTGPLGLRWLDRVPALIPVSWFAMALPAYALARARWPFARWRPVLLGSFILLSWDLALDPAMSYATPYWRWESAGPFYGMPLSNLLGWYVTGLVLLTAFAVLGVDRWVARIPARTYALYYGANLIVPVGMCAAAGLWGAVAASLAPLAALAVRRRPASTTADARLATAPA